MASLCAKPFGKTKTPGLLELVSVEMGRQLVGFVKDYEIPSRVEEFGLQRPRLSFFTGREFLVS